MKLKIKLILLACIIIVNATYGQNEQISKEVSSLTTQEMAMFQKIKKVYSDFDYSTKVYRYFKIDNETKSKKQILVEMIFEKVDGLYLDRYIDYAVTFEPESRIIKYKIVLGTSYQGEGSIMVGEKNVIKIEWGCSEISCLTLVYENKKLIFKDPEK